MMRVLQLAAPCAALLVLLALLAFSNVEARAQIPGLPGGAGETEPPSAVVDPLGRGTPRGMLDGLLLSMASDDPSAVFDYLDLSKVPEAQRSWRGRRMATALEAVLARGGSLLPSYRLAMSETGSLDDGLAPDLEAFAQMRTEDGPVDLLARRTQTPEGAVVWLVSPETLALVEARARLAPVALVEEIMPHAWSQTRMAGAPVSHWIALASTLAVAFFGGWAFASALTSAIRRLVGSRWLVHDRTSLLATGAVVGCIFYSWGVSLLGLSIVARASVRPAIEIIAWIALATLAWVTADRLARVWTTALTRRGVAAAISVVTLARRGSKILITIIAILATFSSLGVDLTAWLAAFGIGGLVIALGAQKTVEHLVGTLSIVADKPIRVGDVCSVDGLMGTVEDIGIRSTRIRTFERTVVTIPNGIMSSARIESYAPRDRFLFRHVLRLALDTPPDQIRDVLDALQRALAEADFVTLDPRRARLVGLTPEALEIEVYAYIEAADFDAFLARSEELLLHLLDAVKACGARLAVPTRRVTMNDDERGNTTRPARCLL